MIATSNGIAASSLRLLASSVSVHDPCGSQCPSAWYMCTTFHVVEGGSTLWSLKRRARLLSWHSMLSPNGCTTATVLLGASENRAIAPCFSNSGRRSSASLGSNYW